MIFTNRMYYLNTNEDDISISQELGGEWISLYQKKSGEDSYNIIAINTEADRLKLIEVLQKLRVEEFIKS